MKAMSQNFSVHQEDISTKAAGTAIIAQPCRVFVITVSHEGAGDAVVSLSNSSSSYSNSARVEKVVLTDEKKTHTITYPTGKYLSAGLSATCNLSSIDISVTYE